MVYIIKIHTLAVMYIKNAYTTNNISTRPPIEREPMDCILPQASIPATCTPSVTAE